MRLKTSILVLLFFAIFANANGQNFINGSFETWGNANTCEINNSPDGWIDYSTGCSELDEANFPLCPSTIPANASNGNIYARACAGPDWQGGEGVYQNISGLNIGQVYTFTFDYAGSNLYGGTDSCRWKVFIDDVNIDQTPFFSSSKNTWSIYLVNFVATQTTHKIGVRAYFINPSVTGNGSAGLDNLILTGSGEETGLATTLQNSNIEMYPTLMDQHLRIKSKDYDELEILLYDVNTNLRIRAKSIGDRTLNVEDLLPGIYFCIVKQKGVAVARQTVIKK
ncbi:MAG: hypothetical protein IPJ31_11160 [Bacteroidetes bacterium]|nr:hypothetical protein [Bacteroidota bacterium]